MTPGRYRKAMIYYYADLERRTSNEVSRKTSRFKALPKHERKRPKRHVNRRERYKI